MYIHAYTDRGVPMNSDMYMHKMDLYIYMWGIQHRTKMFANGDLHRHMHMEERHINGY